MSPSRKIRPNQDWYIYALREAGDTLVRYVGFTTALGKRLSSHINDAKLGKNRAYRNKWIRSVLDAGGSIEMVVIERGVGDGWQPRETHWISWYRFIMGSKLTNSTNGGEGVFGL